MFLIKIRLNILVLTILFLTFLNLKIKDVLFFTVGCFKLLLHLKPMFIKYLNLFCNKIIYFIKKTIFMQIKNIKIT